MGAELRLNKDMFLRFVFSRRKVRPTFIPSNLSQCGFSTKNTGSLGGQGSPDKAGHEPAPIRRVTQTAVSGFLERQSRISRTRDQGISRVNFVGPLQFPRTGNGHSVPVLGSAFCCDQIEPSILEIEMRTFCESDIGSFEDLPDRTSQSPGVRIETRRWSAFSLV